MNKETDILIIGATVAGACAAKEAIENNAKVTIINENSKKETNNVEYITKIKLRQLNVKNFKEAIISQVEGFTLVSPDNTEVLLNQDTIALPEPSYIIDLDKLNKSLLNQASKKGVEIVYDTKIIDLSYENNKITVNVLHDNREEKITTDLLIITEEIKELNSEEINLNYDNSLDNIRKISQYKISSNNLPQTNTIKQYYGSFAPGGYAWLYPINKNTAYIGISALKSKTTETDKLLEEFIEKLGIDYEIINKTTQELPVNGIIQERTNDNIILAGDVAGFVNPLTNMKIDNTIASGTYAGVIAAKQYIYGEFDKTSLGQYQMFTDMLIGDDFSRYNDTRKFLLSLTDDDLNTMAQELKNGQLYESDIDSIIRGLIENCSKASLQIKNLYN